MGVTGSVLCTEALENFLHKINLQTFICLLVFRHLFSSRERAQALQNISLSMHSALLTFKGGARCKREMQRWRGGNRTRG